MSSTFGRSARSFKPNRIRNSLVVAYRNGRPTTCLRPTILIRCRSSSVLRTPAVLTPRISVISSGGNRLLVSDDGERFERLHRQLLRRALVEQPPHPFVQVRPGDDLVAARHLHQLQSARAVVVVLQLRDRRLDVFLRLGVEQLVDRLAGQRLGRREDQRLDESPSARRTPRAAALSASCALRASPPILPVPAVRSSCPFLPVRRQPRCASGSPIGCGASAGRARL